MSGNKQKKLLLVDDNKSITDMLSQYFTMKNYLTNIVATAEIIKKNPEFDMIKDLKRYIDMIERSALKINNQVEDVLNFVRFSPLKSEYISLSKILQNTLKTIQIPAGIKVVLPETDITVNCNANQLEIVLSNLINNSIEAIENDGEIVIGANEDNENSIIEVKDSGLGIPEENIRQIFEPLFTTKQSGTGLGLATCKHIIERHGGTINIKNNPTTFSITIPKH